MQGQGHQRWPDRYIARLADAQHGVVALWQLRDAGFTRGAIDSRLALGRLHIIRRGVYAPGNRLITQQGRWMAAVLSLGALAVLSHVSAAVAWGLLAPWSGARIHVTIPERNPRKRRTDLAVHRAPGVETTVHDGIPITTVAWTLLDLAATQRPRTVERAVEAAERLRLFDLADVERLTATQRPGCRALRVAIATYDDAPTRSELERRFLELCQDHGLPRPQVNVWLPECAMEVDALWPQARVVVELDGRAHHGTAAAFERDRHRDAHLALAGYRTARFSWRQVVDEPATVAAVVRALLAPAPSR